MRAHHLRSILVSAAVAGPLLAAACGPSPQPQIAKAIPSAKPSALPKPPEPVLEKVAPHVCVGRAKLTQLIADQLHQAPPAAPNVTDADAKDAPAAPPPAAAGRGRSAHEAYTKTAPATVLIRTKHSMGTGVVVDPSGLVLTNYHVVDDGKQPDFTFKVTIELGKLTGAGRMVRGEKSYEGIVYKADPLRDVALVKIVDPPAKLPSLKLASRDPQIGEPVLSVGHASIGFLWAAKGCQVANIGEPNRDISLLAGIDCKSQRDDAKDPSESDKVEKNCETQKQNLKDLLGSKNQGLLVQTDCAITHGDSGGPLVTADGDIVAINQSIRVDRATTSFHVHVAELRDFMKDIPKKPAQVTPDVWCDGGLQQTLEDADLDGKFDTLITRGFDGDGRMDRVGYLLDLDQDQFVPHGGSAPFDAEVALLNLKDGTYVWYDTDNDGRFDVMLVDKDGKGHPNAAFRLAADGSAEKDDSLKPEHDFDVALLKDPKLHARLGHIAGLIRPSGFTSEQALAEGAKLTVPDPLWGGGRNGRALDLDRDGKPDVVAVTSAFAKAALFDADEDSLSSLKPGEEAKALLEARKVDAELSLVQQGTTYWAIYDTNNDGKFDLALVSPKTDDWRLALGAWTLGEGGAMTPAPEHIGRKLIRPALLNVEPGHLLKSLEAMSVHYAKDDGMGSVPNPLRSKNADFALREVAGYPGAVVEMHDKNTTALLIDPDRDQRLTKASKIKELMGEGKLKFDFVLLNHGGKEWVYYDADADGKFDLVLFAARPQLGVPQSAFRVGKLGSFDYDAAAVSGKLVRFKGVFKKPAVADAFKKIAPLVFRKIAIEE